METTKWTNGLMAWCLRKSTQARNFYSWGKLLANTKFEPGVHSWDIVVNSSNPPLLLEALNAATSTSPTSSPGDHQEITSMPGSLKENQMYLSLKDLYGSGALSPSTSQATYSPSETQPFGLSQGIVGSGTVVDLSTGSTGTSGTIIVSYPLTWTGVETTGGSGGTGWTHYTLAPVPQQPQPLLTQEEVNMYLNQISMPKYDFSNNYQYWPATIQQQSSENQSWPTSSPETSIDSPFLSVEICLDESPIES